VGFKPGVTDNVGKAAKEAMEWRLGRKLKEEEKVYTSLRFEVWISGCHKRR